MKNITQNSDLYIKLTDKGRGVFTKKFIKRGSLIERCPVLVIGPKDEKKIEGTLIERYWFEWKENHASICFGYGSLYNHDFNPNAYWDEDHKNNTLRFLARRNILPNEEITTNYIGDEPEEEFWKHYVGKKPKDKKTKNL